MKKVIAIFIVILCLTFISSIFFLLNKNVNNSDNTSVNNNTTNVSTKVDYSKLSYLAFGDSITAGSGLESRTMSYPNVTASMLGCSINNRAVGGSTLCVDTENANRHCICDDILSYINSCSNYDIISVTGGSNDKGRALPLGTFDDNSHDSVYGSLNVIASALKRKFPNSFIFFMTPIKHPNCEVNNSAGYNLEDVSNAIKEVAEKFNIPVLDLYNTSQFENVACGMNNENCDGWHPLKEFVNYFLAPQVTQFIKDNYNK